MKKRIIALCMAVGLIGMTVFATNSAEVRAWVVDRKIEFASYPDWHYQPIQHPLLAYDGYTYIAARDVANMLRREVTWNEECSCLTLLLQYGKENSYILNTCKKYLVVQ